MKREKKLSESLVEYILTRNLDEIAGLSVESCAKHLGVSRSYLFRKKNNEMTIEKLIFSAKMESALELLECLPVAEVSARLGFSRCDYFIKIFRRHFGASPKRYLRLRNERKRR